jgi:hypothetical protein
MQVNFIIIFKYAKTRLSLKFIVSNRFFVIFG